MAFGHERYSDERCPRTAPALRHAAPGRSPARAGSGALPAPPRGGDAAARDATHAAAEKLGLLARHPRRALVGVDPALARVEREDPPLESPLLHLLLELLARLVQRHRGRVI